MFGLATAKEVRDLRHQLDYIKRQADNRWNELQERHDAVIELIVQIPECGCNNPGRVVIAEVKPQPKPRKKAK